MNSNERERRLLENQRREREEEEIKFASKLSNELKKQWKNLSENQLQRMRDKNAEEIKELDQAESELRNKLVN